MEDKNKLTDIFYYQIFAKLDGLMPETEIASLQAMVALMRVAADLKEGMNRGFAKYGISQNKYYILLHLYEKKSEELNPSAIAQFAGLARGTTTELIEGLEHDGLVERSMSANDRRMVQVQITQKGRDFMQEVVPFYYQLTSQLISCLTPEDTENLKSILKKLGRNLQDLKL